MAFDQVGPTIVTQEPTVVAGRDMVRTHSRRITPLTFVRGLSAFGLLAAGLLISASPASAATIAAKPASPASEITTLTIGATTTCSNGYLTAVAGLGIICDVTVVNTVTATGGSATVTVHECHGPAGPVAAQTDCSDQTLILAMPVTAITQCNSSINGGGTTLRCSIVVTNNFVGLDPGASAVSVNECVGSGAGGGTAMVCDPLSATISAAITQCNGTGSGGGGSITCTATGTMASALAVTINQCNGASNGGGDLVACSATMTNNAVTAPTPTPTSTTAAPTTAAPTSTPPPTSTLGADSSNSSTLPLSVLLICLAFAGLGLAAVEWRRRSIRS